MEAAVVGLVVPPSVPLCRPCLGETLEQLVVRDADGVALDYDIQPAVPTVATRRESHMRVGAEIERLLFGGACGEVNGSVEPHRDERREGRPTIGADGRDPEQFCPFDPPERLVPAGRNRFRVTESCVELGHWFVHQVLRFRFGWATRRRSGWPKLIGSIALGERALTPPRRTPPHPPRPRRGECCRPRAGSSRPTPQPLYGGLPRSRSERPRQAFPQLDLQGRSSACQVAPGAGRPQT